MKCLTEGDGDKGANLTLEIIGVCKIKGKGTERKKHC